MALAQQQPGARELVVSAGRRLAERGWRGDRELAELLSDRVAGKDRGRPAVPAELDQLADILDQDASTGMGGFRNLNDGQVVPGALLDDIPELADGIEQGNWIYVRAEGARAACCSPNNRKRG